MRTLKLSAAFAVILGAVAHTAVAGSTLSYTIINKTNYLITLFPNIDKCSCVYPDSVTPGQKKPLAGYNYASGVLSSTSISFDTSGEHGCKGKRSGCYWDAYAGRPDGQNLASGSLSIGYDQKSPTLTTMTIGNDNLNLKCDGNTCEIYTSPSVVTPTYNSQ